MIEKLRQLYINTIATAALALGSTLGPAPALKLPGHDQIQLPPDPTSPGYRRLRKIDEFNGQRDLDSQLRYQTLGGYLS